ncbi:MAG: shikimate kinase [Clostridia bacterium]|nr:shikimate kinase [Clostridia bacterium]
MNIVFTGFMGVGKTTVGRQVAKKLGLEFYDTDSEIENFCNMTIPEIFEKFGEKKFREIETQIVEKISQKDGVVISCGGGVVKSETNMNLLKKNGKIVNLYADVDKILKNIGTDVNRPLLKGKDKQEIIDIMAEREKFYQNCDIRIDVTNLSKEDAAQAVINKVKI